MVSPARPELCCHLPLSGQQLCEQAGGSAPGSVLQLASAFTGIHKNVPSIDLGMPEGSDALPHSMLMVGSLRSYALSGAGQNCTPAGWGWTSRTGRTRDC